MTNAVEGSMQDVDWFGFSTVQVAYWSSSFRKFELYICRKCTILAWPTKNAPQTPKLKS